MTYCTRCGKQVAADWTYCPSCGRRRPRERPASLEDYRQRLVAELDNSSQAPAPMPTELDRVAVEIGQAVGRLLPRAEAGHTSDGPAQRPLKAVAVPGTNVRIGLPLAVALALLLLLAISVATDGIGLLALLALFGAATLIFVSGRGSRSAGRSVDLHATIAEKLDTCHTLIAEIEGTIGIDLLPSNSPLMRDYAAALEARAEGWDRFEHATTRAELAEADRVVDRALNGLRRTRDALAAEGRQHPAGHPRSLV